MQPESDPPARPGQARTGTLPLVGRTFEVQRIGACLERARRGAGSVVLVLGDSGIGKTRLAAEATDIAMIANVPAVLLGSVAAKKIPMTLVHAVAAGIFLVLGLLTLFNVGGMLPTVRS